MLIILVLKGGKGSGWYSPPKGTHSGEKHRAVGSGKSGTLDWKPAMTARESANWVKGTALEGRSFFHHTDAKSADSIAANGFRASEGFYGVGVYLTDSADVGSAGLFEEGEVLDIVVRVNSPVIGRRNMDVLYDEFDPEFTMEPLELLAVAGRDAYILPRTDGSTWVMVPNPKNVTIVE